MNLLYPSISHHYCWWWTSHNSYQQVKHCYVLISDSCGRCWPSTPRGAGRGAGRPMPTESVSGSCICRASSPRRKRYMPSTSKPISHHLISQTSSLFSIQSSPPLKLFFPRFAFPYTPDVHLLIYKSINLFSLIHLVLNSCGRNDN